MLEFDRSGMYLKRSGRNIGRVEFAGLEIEPHMVLLWQLHHAGVPLVNSCSLERELMKRYGSVIEVKGGMLDEYVKLRVKVWPGVLDMIRRCNIRNYSIYTSCRMGSIISLAILNIQEMTLMGTWPKWRLTPPRRSGGMCASHAMNRLRIGLRGSGGPPWKIYFILIDGAGDGRLNSKLLWKGYVNDSSDA